MILRNGGFVMPAPNPEVTAFYEQKTGSVQYVVTDPATRQCAIIDPVWNYDERSARTTTESVQELIDYVDRERLTVVWVMDTHPHADHMSATKRVSEHFNAPTAIGNRITEVQKPWQTIYNLGDTLQADASQWDHLLADGDTFRIGELTGYTMACPGHTLASMTYVIGNAAFIHDTLFMPDGGSARADFPGGDARALYRSIQRILSLPDDTRLFVGHDYCPNGREPRWESTVAEQRAHNIHLQQCPTEDEYVAMREGRDAQLQLPNLMLESLQVNIRGGQLPPAEDDGRHYLKIPLNHF